MYYHSRPMKYVKYDKVYPPDASLVDQDYLKAYRWLGTHCGYCPQIWLSRSTSAITCYRQYPPLFGWPGKKENRSGREFVLFGFEHIKGFPLSYDRWCSLLSESSACATNAEIDREIIATLDWLAKDYAEYPESYPEQEEPHVAWWREHRDLVGWLERFLFRKRDQVVVPALNLKAAKKIICRNEKQRKKLRKMGFIEDRIRIDPMLH